MSLKAPKDISPAHLITPSASPPPHSRPTRNNSASPSKRQRTNSVSRSSSSQCSVSVSDPNFDIHREREASRTRLLDTWSQLAERYSRPLDEDDIVDIRTGEIVRDNGFLRSTRRYQFGEVLAPVGAEETGAEGSDDEDGVDELDAFSEERHLLEDIFTRGIKRYMSRAETPHPGDEDDLEDFLKAEQRRKVEYGSDFEEDEYEASRVSITRTISPTLESSNASDDDYGGNSEQSVLGDPAATSSFPVEPEESGSNDELDNWDLTEASKVVVSGDVRKTPQEEEQSDSASEIQIIEAPTLNKRASSPKRRISPVKPNAPPGSHSSIDQPSLGCIDIPLSKLPSPPSTREARKVSASPTKVQPFVSESRARGINVRSQILEVIDITDDEVELGQNWRLNSPSPPPSPSPIQAPGNRALTVVPEVVIRTLPPHAGKVKGLTLTSILEPSLHSPKADAGRPSVSELIPEIGEVPPVYRPSEPQTQTRMYRKRKRVSSEHEKIIHTKSAEIIPREAMQPKARAVMKGRSSSVSLRQSLRQSKSRSATPPSGDGAFSDPDEDGNYQRRHVARHFASGSAASSPQSPHPPHATPLHNPGLYLPSPDIRAQQIITSAMQQLATLLWTSSHSSTGTPTHPYTPTHHRFSSVGPSVTYSTPHHPHPYPFNYDPSFSRATLPPSSPDPPSSPTKIQERRKSIVSRSHSRGRKVSFCVDQTESHSDSESESTVSEPYLLRKEKHRNALQSKGKGKGADRNTSSFGSESEEVEYVQGTEQRRLKPTRAKPQNVVRSGLGSRRSGAEPSTSYSKPSSKSSSKKQTKHYRDASS